MEKLIPSGTMVRIVGLGTMEGDEICVQTGKEATGYVEFKHELTPVNLKAAIGPGCFGEFAKVL